MYLTNPQIGSRIFVAGQIPLDPGSMTILNSDVVDQSLLSLRHVERILQAKHTGCTLQNALSLVCYVTDVLHIPPARDTIKTEFLTNNDKVSVVSISTFSFLKNGAFNVKT